MGCMSAWILQVFILKGIHLLIWLFLYTGVLDIAVDRREDPTYMTIRL